MLVATVKYQKIASILQKGDVVTVPGHGDCTVDKVLNCNAVLCSTASGELIHVDQVISKALRYMYVVNTQGRKEISNYLTLYHSNGWELSKNTISVAAWAEEVEKNLTHGKGAFFEIPPSMSKNGKWVACPVSSEGTDVQADFSARVLQA